MPDRIIRERATRSPTLKALTDAGERAWWRLTVKVDDYGRFDAEPEVLLSQLFERRPAGWTSRKMATVVDEWTREDVDLVHLYRIAGDDRIYGHVVTWTDHQRERDSKPKYPDPPCGNSPQLAAKCRESRQSAAYSESRESGVGGREARTQSAAPTGGADDNGFHALWALHPGPKGPKAEALKAYRQAKPPPGVVEAMRAQLSYGVACARRGEFCAQLPHLHRWLKKRRWEDEIPQVAPGPHDHLPESRVCAACGEGHLWREGKRLEPCPKEGV